MLYVYMLYSFVQMAAAHSDAFNIVADIPVLNASLQYANDHLDDVIGPLIDQSTANLRLADEHLTFCEYNIESIARTRNATYLALTSQSHFVTYSITSAN